MNIWESKKFNVGEKVRIKRDLEADNEGYIESEMLEYCGEICTIVEKYPDCYLLDIDEKEWAWSDSMLEEHIDMSISFDELINILE